jgi:hypothetical protein
VPGRILREGILTSEPVNSLSAHAELFYRRLMSVVDDFGRYFANPQILRSACYPVQVDRVREADISRWLTECETAGLILLYEVDGKKYLIYLKTDEPRAKFSKFPEPPPELARICAHMRPYSNASSNSNSKSNTRGKPPNPLPPLPPDLATPEFSAAFERWRKHREEIRKPLKPTMCEAQFAKFRAWGIPYAIVVIDHTIGNGWWGLREPEPNGVAAGANGNGRRSSRRDADNGWIDQLSFERGD